MTEREIALQAARDLELCARHLQSGRANDAARVAMVSARTTRSCLAATRKAARKEEKAMRPSQDIVSDLASILTIKLAEDIAATLTAERIYDFFTTSVSPVLVEAVNKIRANDRAEAHEVMRQCAERFREYEKHHREKPDTEKADSNAVMAMLCEQMLADSVSASRGDPDNMNKDRAEWAGHAVEQFQRLTGCDGDDAFGDLLCDLMHYADARGIEWHRALAIARGSYKAETYVEPGSKS